MNQRLRQEEDNISIHSSLSSTPTETTPLIVGRLPDNEKDNSTWMGELKWLTKNALPIVFTFLMQNSLQMASIFTLGHLVSWRNGCGTNKKKKQKKKIRFNLGEK
jgi:hypothetical protein